MHKKNDKKIKQHTSKHEGQYSKWLHICLVTTVQAGGGGVNVWEMFSWYTLGLLVPIECDFYIIW